MKKLLWVIPCMFGLLNAMEKDICSNALAQLPLNVLQHIHHYLEDVVVALPARCKQFRFEESTAFCFCNFCLSIDTVISNLSTGDQITFSRILTNTISLNCNQLPRLLMRFKEGPNLGYDDGPACYHKVHALEHKDCIERDGIWAFVDELRPSVYIIDLNSFKKRRFKLANFLAISQGNYVAIGNENKISIYDYKTFNIVKTIQAHDKSIIVAPKFSKDGMCFKYKRGSNSNKYRKKKLAMKPVISLKFLQSYFARIGVCKDLSKQTTGL